MDARNGSAYLMFLGRAGEEYDIDTESYVTRLIDNIQKTHETYRNALKMSQQMIKRDYDLRMLEKSTELKPRMQYLQSAMTR